MEYKINDVDLSTKEIEVTLQYDDIKKEIDAEVLKQTKSIQIPGFRKGKVPLQVIKRMYGDALEYEASEKVANSQFWKIVKENDLKPVGQPQLSDLKFNPGQDLFFKVTYEVVPEIDVKDYTGNDIEVPDLTAKDSDVQAEWERMLRSSSTEEAADEVGEGNNFVIKVKVNRVDENGSPFEGSTPETIDIDFTNQGIAPQIVENAKGKKIGESFSFSFTDERNLKNPEGVEETVTETFYYTAEILEIKTIVAPELNEEFFKGMSGDKATTEQELKDKMKSDLQGYLDERIDEFAKNRLLDLIITKNDFNPPHSIVHNVLDDLVKQEEEESKRKKQKKFDRNEAHQRLHKRAEVEVKWLIIKDAIKKKENITINDDDLSELAAKDSEKMGIPADKLLNYYKSSNYSDRILDNKLFDFLREKNNIKRVNPDELNKNVNEENK